MSAAARPASASHIALVCSLQVKKETSTVVLNTAKLELGTVSVLVTPAGGAAPHTMEASSRDFDETFERGLFSFPGALPAGAKARLSLAFKGALTGDMLGYYFSKGGADGETVYTLTQFEVSPSPLLPFASGPDPARARGLRGAHVPWSGRRVFLIASVSASA